MIRGRGYLIAASSKAALRIRKDLSTESGFDPLRKVLDKGHNETGQTEKSKS
jgi:hypothetical protein